MRGRSGNWFYVVPKLSSSNGYCYTREEKAWSNDCFQYLGANDESGTNSFCCCGCLQRRCGKLLKSLSYNIVLTLQSHVYWFVSLELNRSIRWQKHSKDMG